MGLDTCVFWHKSCYYVSPFPFHDVNWASNSMTQLFDFRSIWLVLFLNMNTNKHWFMFVIQQHVCDLWKPQISV